MDKRRERNRWIVAGAALAFVLLVAETAAAVTLEEAVRAALKTNPQVGAVVENRRATDHELSQARSGFFPTVDLNASSGKEYANNSTTRNRQLDGDDSRTTGLPTSSFGLTIRQLLFDGFDTLSQVERQEARVRSAARRVRETSEFVGLDAVEAYLESLRQRELIGITEDNIRAHETYLELVRARVAGGAAGRAEEQQARQRLAQTRDALAQADGLRRDADARYRLIMGEEPIALSRPGPPVDALPPTVDQAIQLAVRFNPTIRVSRTEVQIAEAEYKQTKSSQWPQLSFEVNANTARNSGGERGGSHTLSALLVMNYNLYNGGADVARRSEFLARLGEARQRLARTQRETDESTRVAWNALINARERLAQLRTIVKANEQIRDNFKKEFDVGRRDLLDLLNAENDYFQARGNLVSAEFVELLGIYRILNAAGLLLTALDVAPSPEASVDDAAAAEFNNTLQEFVERTPALERQGTGEGAIQGTGTAPSPLSPTLPPLDPTRPLDPNAPIVAPPGTDLMTPLGPAIDPTAPLDPNAPVLDPTAPIPGVPRGAHPGPAGPTRLLPQNRAGLSDENRPKPRAFVDTPRLVPHVPHRLDAAATGDAGSVPPSDENPARVMDRIPDAKPQTAQRPNFWWFGPAAAGAEERSETRASGVTAASTPARPAPVWGFD